MQSQLSFILPVLLARPPCVERRRRQKGHSVGSLHGIPGWDANHSLSRVFAPAAPDDVSSSRARDGNAAKMLLRML